MNSYRMRALMAASAPALAVLVAGPLLLVWAFAGQKDDGKVEPPRQVVGTGETDVKLQGARKAHSTLKEPESVQRAFVDASTQLRSATQPRALKPADLEYKGSFAPPWSVKGISTSYTNIGLAMRKVKGKLQFFAGAGPDDDGVYEMDFPGLAIVTAADKTYPKAKVIKWWGDIWQGKCIVTEKNKVVKQGLYWDETKDRLYWTYACSYPASGTNDQCFGWTDLSGAAPKAHGPFRVRGGAVATDDKFTRAVSSSCRGGITRIPAWFAAKYTNKQALGLGFGGYYNIISSGVSMGPALFAVSDPEDGTKEYPAIPCVGHTFVQGKPGLHYCKRSPDYTGDGDWAAPLAKKETGSWTAMDTIGSAGCWVDLTDISGLVIMADLATGPVNYEVMNGRAKRGGSDNWLYIYDPTDLAEVATGKKYPWEIEPASMTKFPTPLGGRINGMVFETETRTLYVLATHAVHEKYESYPLIHAFQVKHKA